MIHAVINALGAVGDGGGGSPLSPTSQVSELLRVMQFAIAGGVWYLINQMRKNRNGNDEAHGQVQRDVRNIAHQISSVKEELQNTRAEVSEIQGRQVREGTK